jgi:hypothetical protein
VKDNKDVPMTTMITLLTVDFLPEDFPLFPDLPRSFLTVSPVMFELTESFEEVLFEVCSG